MTAGLSLLNERPAENPGWRGYLRLGFHRGVRRTELSDRARSGPLSVQRPFYPEDNVCHVYMLHPPGGVVGGDQLDIDVDVNADASALITTPGAGKFYRSAGEDALVTQRLQVKNGASLEWLPQENIFFPGAKARVDTHIELAARSRLAWWEVQCFGRPAINESFTSGAVESRLEIRVSDRPVLIERPRIDPDSRRRLGMMASLPVSATLVLYSCTNDHLQIARQALDASTEPVSDEARIGITLVDDLLVMRYLGGDAAEARRCLSLIWRALRDEVIGHTPVTPRIWRT